MSDASERLAEAMRQNGITVESVFIPWSQSRNVTPNPKMSDRSLNWRVTLKRADRDVYTTDYSAGIGHCPSFNQREWARPSLDYAEKIARETETGRSATIARKPIIPNAVDVFSALLNDADTIDYPTFEQWASEMGSDPDSRKAEAIYRESLACGLALRAALGDHLLTQLRELAREIDTGRD